MKEPLSIRLMRALRVGIGKLSSEATTLIRQYVESQCVSGEVCFMNKSGVPDLYYTAFGWLLAALLDIKLDRERRKVFLGSQEKVALNLIHYAALMRCYLLDDWMDKGGLRLALTGITRREVRNLDSFRETPQGDACSPYSQFIWQGVLEDTGNGHLIKIQDLENYHVATGGYANYQEKVVPTINATAAALAIKGQLEGWKKNTDVEALRQMQEDNGGFKASPSAPLADLLSTATALFILKQYKVKPAFNAEDFIISHWQDGGGFSATILDDSSDVEYVFYGLLAIGAI